MVPRGPPDQRTSTWALSSSRRPGTAVKRSAATASASQPGDEAARLKACTPISASTADWPARAGSVRHSACFWPVGVDRQRQPVLDIARVHGDELAELARRDHLARLPHHGVAGVVQRDEEVALPRSSPAPRSASASASVVDSGLSQITSMPASRKARGDRRVQVVRRDDDDRLDAVRPLGLEWYAHEPEYLRFCEFGKPHVYFDPRRCRRRRRSGSRVSRIRR